MTDRAPRPSFLRGQRRAPRLVLPDERPAGVVFLLAVIGIVAAAVGVGVLVAVFG